MTNNYIFWILLWRTVAFVNGSESYTVATKSPSSYACHYCEDDNDCLAIMRNSTCIPSLRQCANKEGLFGLGCSCETERDCISGRCDGFLRLTCQEAKDEGDSCHEGSDCKSGVCSPMKVCEADGSSKLTPSQPTLIPLFPELAEPEDEENPNEDILVDASADDSTLVLQECIPCGANDDFCGSGICLRGLCTDAAGKHPMHCFNCETHQACGAGYYCDGSGLLGRTAKKCMPRSPDGAKCIRNEGCQSNNCNMLFRCAPGDDLKKSSPGQSVNKASDAAVWGSIIGVAIVLGLGVVAVAWSQDKSTFTGCFNSAGVKSDTGLNSKVGAQCSSNGCESCAKLRCVEEARVGCCEVGGEEGGEKGTADSCTQVG